MAPAFLFSPSRFTLAPSPRLLTVGNGTWPLLPDSSQSAMAPAARNCTKKPRDFDQKPLRKMETLDRKGRSIYRLKKCTDLGEAIDLAGDGLAGEAEAGLVAEVVADLGDEVVTVGVAGVLRGELLHERLHLPQPQIRAPKSQSGMAASIHLTDSRPLEILETLTLISPGPSPRSMAVAPQVAARALALAVVLLASPAASNSEGDVLFSLRRSLSSDPDNVLESLSGRFQLRG